MKTNILARRRRKFFNHSFERVPWHKNSHLLSFFAEYAPQANFSKSVKKAAKNRIWDYDPPLSDKNFQFSYYDPPPYFPPPPPIVNDWSLKSHYKRATCETTTGVFCSFVLDRDIWKESITRRTNLLTTVFGDGLHKIPFHQALCAEGGNSNN